MKIRPAGRAVILLLLVFAPFLPPIRGNQRKEPPSLQHEVRVALKLVQAIVTDRRGRPVTDLELSDFEVRDNGKKVDLTVFEKHFLPAAGETVLRPPELPASEKAAETGRKFFFLIDAQQSDVIGFGQAKKAALHFLETRIKPDDEVGLLSYQLRRGLIMHAFLSRDRVFIKKTLEDLRAIPGNGGEGEVTDPFAREDADAFLFELESTPPAAEAEADAAAARRMNYTATLRELAKALRGVPGTKNIVFFSAGYARSTLESDVLFQKAFEDMAKEFAASSCPVFTVDVMGLRARFSPPDARGDHSLKTLSEYSGGRFFDDVARKEDVAVGLQGATANYYVLGYSIGEEWDGRRHEIEVGVKRAGCLVSAPSGYFSPKPFSDFTDFEKQIHLFDAVFNDRPQFEIPVELPAVLLPWRDEGGAHFLFLTELPWTGLPDIVLPPAELFSILTDSENRIIEMNRGDFVVPDTEKKRPVYYGILSPPAGFRRATLLVRNAATGKTARARVSTTAMPAEDSGLEMDPPLLLVAEDERDVVFLRLTEAGAATGEISSPGIKDVFPFLSSRLVPVLDEVRSGTKAMLAAVRTRISGIPEARIEMSAVLNPETGDERLLDSTIIDVGKQGKTDVLLLEFPLPDLSAGSYAVTITAQEEKSGASVAVRRTFRII